LLLNQGKLLFAGTPAELTGRVAGRVYRLSGIIGRRRPILTKALDEEGVLDGVIQGEAIRLVMEPGKHEARQIADIAGPRAKLEPTEPRFEDAFVDMLGGGPGGRSKLAEAATPLAAEGGPV